MSVLLEAMESARGRWRGILTHFGLDPKYLENKHGPCPMCGGKDRWRWDDRDGSGSFFCSACGSGDGLDLMAAFRGWDRSRSLKELRAVLGWNSIAKDSIRPEQTDAQKKDGLLRLWRSSKLLTPDTPAGIYLESRCGNLSGLTDDLRAHPALHYERGKRETFPGLIARLSYIDGKTASIHRTFLTPDGRKAPLDPARKMMPGFPLEGAAIRLGPVQERMGIAEGLETAICAGKLFGIPVWSATSAEGVKSWSPPEGVHAVVIFGDNDASFTGQAAAYDLARRLRLKLHLDVEVRIPPRVDTDWADVWGEERRAA